MEPRRPVAERTGAGGGHCDGHPCAPTEPVGHRDLCLVAGAGPGGCGDGCDAGPVCAGLDGGWRPGGGGASHGRLGRVAGNRSRSDRGQAGGADGSVRHAGPPRRGACGDHQGPLLGGGGPVQSEGSGGGSRPIDALGDRRRSGGGDPDGGQGQGDGLADRCDKVPGDDAAGSTGRRLPSAGDAAGMGQADHALCGICHIIIYA